MKHWIYKAKRWLVHKLGGRMPDEGYIDPSAVKHLKLVRRYSIDCRAYRRDYTVGYLREKVVRELAEGLIPYIKSEYSEDFGKHEYVIRASIRVVDDRR